MDFLRKNLASIKAQLGSLTVSQKLLIGLLVVVMFATIFFTVAFSAKPEMVVLIAQPMSAEDINTAEMYLKGKYEYQVQGDKILVPSDKAYAIRGELFAAQALPKNTTEAFTALIHDSSFLKMESTSVREWNVAKGDTLARVLRGFPYIQDAAVIIGQGERGALGRESVPTSAMVTIKTRDQDGLTTQQVVAIVDMVRGAVAGLKRENVHVIDGMRSYHAPSDDTPMPSDMLAFKKTIEEDLSQKLYTMFGDIGNVKIAVNAVPDLSVRKQTKETYAPKPVSAVVTETSRDMSTTEGSGAAEPGVKPNVSASVADGGNGRRSNSTTSDTSTTNENHFSKVIEDAVLPAGTELKDLTASISIPRSYFLSIYRRTAHDPKADPDDDKLQPIIDQQLKLAQARARNTIGAKTDDQIHVDWFDDTIAVHTMDVSQTTLASKGALPAVLSQYAKQGVLAAVAIGVLGMMLMMVRKAVPGSGGTTEVDPSVFFGGQSGGGKGKRKGGDQGSMDAGEDVYGEANQGEAVLTGIELDDETLQSRKMVDEVSTMIKENPENAASLVKRWINKGK